MKYTRALIIPFIALVLSACNKTIGPNVEPKDKGMVDIKRIEQRWVDGVQLALSTPKIALSPQIANLQSIKRDLDGVAVGECLKEAKTALHENMDLTIQTFFAFMDGRVSNTAKDARDKIVAYEQARDKCAK